MRLFFSALRGEFDKAIREVQAPIARAATLAIRDAGEAAKAEGRADIASAGFGKKWQNALRADYFPKRKDSMHPAALLRHKIPYAGVFEDGAAISGKPYLYLPLDTVPLGSTGKPLTPKQYASRVGPLSSGKTKDGKPLLFGKGSRSTILKATDKVTRLRRGAVKRGIRKISVPLFVGVPTVNIRKKFNLRRIFARAGDRLGELYVKNFKP